MAADLVKVRNELVAMLMSDRAAALRQKNASAAISASTKIADLLLSRMAEIEVERSSVAAVTHRIVYQVMCPACKERGAETANPPVPPEPLAATPPKARTAWDDIDPTPETPPVIEPPPVATVAVPRRPDQHHREPTRIVRGLA